MQTQMIEIKEVKKFLKFAICINPISQKKILMKFMMSMLKRLLDRKK